VSRIRSGDAVVDGITNDRWASNSDILTNLPVHVIDQ